MGHISVTPCLSALKTLLETHGDDLPLAEALLTAALEEHPDLDPAPYLQRLDDLAGRVRALTGRVGVLQAMRQALFEEAGLRGNDRHYYDRRNSLLNEVLDRGLGLPITLAVIYVEVARRAGGQAEGVGFPGHFLVRHHLPGNVVLVDAFAGGQVVGRSELEALLERTSGSRVTLEPWMTEPTPAKNILTRVLTNLKHAYVLDEDLVGAVTALDRLLLVDPSRADERRDRGLLYGQLGMGQAAAVDLQAYLDATPDAPDGDRIRELLPHLQVLHDELN
jgi:regulator of sirC expression with transglutaminase-like and TPR domain